MTTKTNEVLSVIIELAHEHPRFTEDPIAAIYSIMKDIDTEMAKIFSELRSINNEPHRKDC